MKKRRMIICLAATMMIMTTGCGTQNGETTTEIETGLTFEDLASDEVSLIALGNSDVPVGQYSQEILENLGIWEQIQTKISFGSNVKEVLSQVEENTVDCGIVYATDAATSQGVQVTVTAPEGSLSTPVVYPAAILTEAQNKETADLFLQYLMTAEAAAEFETVGFTYVAETSAMPVDNGASGEIMIFAAASMTEVLTTLGDSFTAAYPNIKVQFSFDSSGTLLTQIEEGAQADIFISAAQKQMDTLEEEQKIDSASRIDLLSNEVVLIVPAN
ncbi:MAG: molybdate ABC transporter substrate-binding protein [Lachnospiraceae bacterium]